MTIGEPAKGGDSPVDAGTPRHLALFVGAPSHGDVRALGPGIELRRVAGGGALAALDRERPDVLLLDAREPAELLDALLERVGPPGRAGRPGVILVTHGPQLPRLSDGLAERADDFVSAGFGPEVLAARVRSTLRVHGMLGELARKNAELEALSARLEALAARMADELRLASRIQRTLLPPHLVHPRIDLAAEYLPVREIGGDYYDVIPLEGGRLAIALGDVMGKGVPAALLAANLKACLRAHVQAGPLRPAETLVRVHRLFVEVVPRGLFATLFFAVLDPFAGTLEYVNAGHQPGLLARAEGGEIELCRGGAALGLVEEPSFDTGQQPLRPGDVLVLFSDGLPERPSPAGELFGRERIRACIAETRHDPARIALYTLLGEVQGWSGGGPADDDQTLIVARVR